MAVQTRSGGSVMPGPRGTYCEFHAEPVCVKQGGAAAGGSTGDVNEMLLGGHGLVPACHFEYLIKGAGQTLVAPARTAVGLSIALDQTNAEGVEITQGILYRAGSPTAFKVGTDPAFFVRVRAKIEDASGAAQFLVGFRKCEAYQAAYTGYADYAYLGALGTANPNTIKSSTEVAGGGTTDTTSTATWADGVTKDLMVKVDRLGNVTYWLSTDEGATWTQLNSGTAYAFTSPLEVCPSLVFLHGGDVAGTVELILWECGLE